MQFINTAFLEITLVGALSGIVGAIACLRRRVFYTQALTHATFPGAIIGVVFVSKVLFESLNYGLDHKAQILSVSIFIGGALLCIPMIYFMDIISKVKGQGPNTAAGVLLTVGFALGFLLLKLFQPIPLKVNSFISGNILTANSLDIQVTSIALIACIITLLAYGKQIIFACFDETGMQASGYNLRKTDFIILIMITVTVVIAMPAVGSVLSISLIVGPASAAIKLSSSIWQTVIFAPILGIIAGTLGLYSSIYLGLSSGGMITVFSAIVYIVCVIIYHTKNMIIKFIQAKRDVTQMA